MFIRRLKDSQRSPETPENHPSAVGLSRGISRVTRGAGDRKDRPYRRSAIISTRSDQQGIFGRMTDDTALTYVTDEMRAAQGQWGGMRTAPPITATDIRRWAMATYYPQQPPRIYWDADHAATPPWGAIVAPPDF
ncbi:MAG: MaoC family dehydratase, partial [Gammaproteobacteria bacterium]|nr:MaoC family dehydratase [Gammaproteobacteria bacterium]